MNILNSIVNLDILGILILVISSFLFFIFKEFRITRKIFILIFSVMVIRIGLIIINAYFYTLPGSDADAQRFMRNARLFTNGEIEYENFVGAIAYEYFLSFFLNIIDHLLVAISLSNIAFFISILFILKIFSLLNIRKNIQFLCLIIILFYPSLMLHSVTTLREPFQFLFLTITIFSYLMIIYRGFKFPYILSMYISAILFGLLHNGLLGFVPVILTIVTVGILKSTRIVKNKFIIMAHGLIILLLTFILLLSGTISSNMVDAIIDGEATDYAETYREYVPDVRSSYSSTVNISNPLVGVLTISNATIKYFTSPLPWEISSIKDIVSVVENITRLFLLYYIFKHRKHLRFLLAPLLIYLSLEVLWAMGTANWGTAARHHVVQSQILLITFAYIKNCVSNQKDEDIL